MTIGEYITVAGVGQVLKKFTDYDPNLYSPTIKPVYAPKPALETVPADANIATSSAANVRNAVLMGEWAAKEADKHSKTFPDDSSYAGDLINGEPSGFGVITYASGDVIKGQWVDGVLSGWGQKLYADGYKYSGEFQQSKRHGYGRCYTDVAGKDDWYKHEGLYVNGAQCGYGELKNKHGTYMGTFADNKYAGHFICQYVDGDSFEGEYVNDLRHGKGVYKYDSGAGDYSKYEGMYANGKKQGLGTFTSRDGAYHTGQFVNDVEEGKFKYVTSEGKRYDWVYKHGKIQ